MNVVQEMYRNGSQGAWSWIEIRFLEILSHAYDCLSLKAHAAPSVGMHMASNTQHTRLMSKTSHDSLSPADPWPLPHKTAMEELWICKAVVHFWFEVAYGLVGKWSLWCHCHNCHLPPTWHNLTIRSPTGWVGKNDSHPLADPGRDGCLEAKQIEQLMRDLAYPGSIWGRELERTRDVVDFFFDFPCDSHGFWEGSFYWLMTAAVVVFHRWWSKEGHVWGFLARSGPLEGNHCDWPGITCWENCVEKIECENCSGHLPEKIELQHLSEAALVIFVKWLTFFFIPQRPQNHGGC